MSWPYFSRVCLPQLRKAPVCENISFSRYKAMWKLAMSVKQSARFCSQFPNLHFQWNHLSWKQPEIHQCTSLTAGISWTDFTTMSTTKGGIHAGLKHLHVLASDHVILAILCHLAITWPWVMMAMPEDLFVLIFSMSAKYVINVCTFYIYMYIYIFVEMKLDFKHLGSLHTSN